MKPDPEQAARLRAAIHALEAQRALLGDAVVDVAIGPLRAQLAALASSAPARRHQRRQVTVLFADITGYTTLSEHVDPERIGNMLGQFWGDVDALVRERRGRVYSHMGDGIMAVWSDTASAEDDAEQHGEERQAERRNHQPFEPEAPIRPVHIRLPAEVEAGTQRGGLGEHPTADPVGGL